MEQQNIITAEAMNMGQQWTIPDRGSVGVLMLILTEAVLFMMFVAAYLVYIGKSVTGPYPADILHTPIIPTICLLSSSFTIYLAEHALKGGDVGKFKIWLLATIALGGEFITSTLLEWNHFITVDKFTITTNLFGSTFYSLVGLHASHVVVGLALMLVAMIASLIGFPMAKEFRRIRLLSWYWHFVDAVWVVVFTVVYVIGK